MQWAFLAAAILFELGGTLSLRMASNGRSVWYLGVLIGYVGAFVQLSLALDRGLNLGVGYGIWAASGVALTAIAARVLFKEPLTAVMLGGITLIIGGVLLVELGATH
jgi:small multidrug resistance pump